MTTPSRRLFLAAGSAGAVFGALSAAATRERKSPLAVAIERHRLAYAKVLADDSDDAALDADGAAMRDVALTPCESDAELLEKIRYLFAHERIAYGAVADMSHEFGSVLLALDLHLTGAV